MTSDLTAEEQLRVMCQLMGFVILPHGSVWGWDTGVDIQSPRPGFMLDDTGLAKGYLCSVFSFQSEENALAALPHFRYAD